jgi:P2-related tail formation protein
MPWVETSSPTPTDTEGGFTSQIEDAMAPWLAYDTNGSLEAYIDALGSMFEQVFSIVADQGFPGDPNYVPGWSTLLDPNNCPTWALPYLAQFVGVTVPPGTDDTTARSLIKAEAGLQRGTAAAIITAAQRNLIGTQTVSLVERVAVNGSADPYFFQLTVRPEELISASALTQAVNNVKPAGVQWTLVITDAFTWNQAIHTFAADTMSFAATASTQP